jgi:hypothetical protein
MEVVLDYEYLRGAKGDIIISVVAKDVLHLSFSEFLPHESKRLRGKGLNWDVWIVP